MSQIPPGWYFAEPSNSPRWWDGSRFLSGMQTPRPDLTDPSPTTGLRATWLAGEEFGTPKSAAWYPDLGWEPPPRALVGGVAPPHWSIGIPSSQDPHETHNVTFSWDLSIDEIDAETCVYAAMSWIEEEEDSELTDGIDATKVPLTWTAPPGWPAAPRGWSPPPKWKAPRKYPKPPRGWVFWQPDSALVRAREQALHERHAARSRRILETYAGVLGELNHVEETVFWVHEKRPQILAPWPTSIRLGATLPPDHPSVRHYWRASDELLLASATLRVNLLNFLYGRTDVTQVSDSRMRHRRALGGYYRSLSTIADSKTDFIIQLIDRKFPLPPPHPSNINWHRVRDQREQIFADAKTDAIDWIADLHTRHYAKGDIRRFLMEMLTEEDSTTVTTSAATAPWARAEDLAAQFLRQSGFTGASRTPDGADAGFDVTGRGIVAQVKYLAAPVGRPDIQRLVGANLHGASMAFFSRSGYSQNALAYADLAQVAVYTIDIDLDRVEPVNQCARALSKA